MIWLQVLGPSLLVLIGGIITWFLKSYIEKIRITEEKLHIERRKIYMDILEPYIKIFTNPDGSGVEKALEDIKSFNYRKTAFEFNLFGSDQVVRAFHKILKKASLQKQGEETPPSDMMKLWGGLLLEIRKSLGNKNTRLDEYDMLRSLIKDIDKYI